MKNLLLVIVLSFVFVSTVFANPFLVCNDPDPAEEVTGYILKFNRGEEIKTSIPLKYDLTNLPDGSYTVTARAENMWGVSEPASLDFIKCLPSAPMDVKISID